MQSCLRSCHLNLFLFLGTATLLLTCLLNPLLTGAAEASGASPTNAPVDAATSWKEAEASIRKFRVAPGFKVELVAADPQLKNAVAFAFDHRGRIYTSETGRYRSSAFDIRHHMSWYDDDLACRTVEDRIALLQKFIGPDLSTMRRETETIRMLRDTNGDGKMDVSTVYAEGFTNVLDGIASGVMVQGDEVWFTNIPDLVRLMDRNGDGQADVREVVHHGFGVRFSLTGHDLHGLIMGPDGRLYFTVGDRGAHIVTKEGTVLDYPDEGAVFRMNLDGTQLEVIARGMRNPQELAFDDFGNLFTGENDCDHGDRERWVHVPIGSDHGWRVGYQFSEQNPGGVWMSERLWWTNFPGRAAYCLPPLAHIENGPSGITCYPGTGLSDAFLGAFFVTHFKGVDNQSGIRMLKLKPDGAGFAVSEDKELIWNTLPTDVDFSPDGTIHFIDWVHGWPKSERGRIYRMVPTQKDPRGSETARRLATLPSKITTRQASEWLAYPDRRVRLMAQYELASRKQWKLLVETALKGPSIQARLHGIWGVGQIARSSKLTDPNVIKALASLLPLTQDADPHIRAQTVQMLGEAKFWNGLPEVSRLLKDDVAAVRAAAARAWGHMDWNGQVRTQGQSFPISPAWADALINAATANASNDPFLTQALAWGLAREAAQRPDRLLTLAESFRHPSPTARLAGLLALRQLAHPALTNFLSDADPYLVLEAARAIHDVPVPSAMPSLAALLDRPEQMVARLRQPSINAPAAADFETLSVRPLVRRALSAAFKIGTAQDARRIAQFVLQTEPLLKPYQAEAVGLLAQWAKPSARDRVLGLWRPLPQRDGSDASRWVETSFSQWIGGAAQEGTGLEVAVAAAQAASRLELASLSPALLSQFQKGGLPSRYRVELLRALGHLKTTSGQAGSVKSDFDRALKMAGTDTDVALRKESARLAATGNAATAAPELAKLLQSGSLPEKQAALAALANIPGTVADEIIYGQLRPWVEGHTTPPELELDILSASEARQDERIKMYLERYRTNLPAADKLAPYRILLKGGNAEAGRKVFVERTEAACVRCHKIKGEGGEVGPDLTDIASKHPRDYLLESIVLPNARIAAGFETVVITQKDDTAVAGILKKETETELEINSPEDGPLVVKKSDIKIREKGMSGMPDGLAQVLSREDLRDLLEFLGTLQAK